MVRTDLKIALKFISYAKQLFALKVSFSNNYNKDVQFLNIWYMPKQAILEFFTQITPRNKGNGTKMFRFERHLVHFIIRQLRMRFVPNTGKLKTQMRDILRIMAFWIGIIAIPSCDPPSSIKDKTDTGTPFVDTSVTDTMNGNLIPKEDEMLSIMSTMVDQCNQLPMSTDLDQNFVKTMIVHHQAGIDMAKLELGKGQNEELKEITKEFIARQTAEIQKLQDLVHHHKPEVPAEEPQDEIYTAMNEMNYKLKKINLTEDTDKNFALLLIPHLENEVALAAQEVINGHHVQLKLFARDMIRETNKEIGRLKNWLDKH